LECEPRAMLECEPTAVLGREPTAVLKFEPTAALANVLVYLELAGGLASLKHLPREGSGCEG